MKLLAGKTILVTRPLHQAQSFVQQIQMLGGKAVVLPTIEILPVNNHPILGSLHQEMGNYQLAIFLSANAVNHALPWLPQPLPSSCSIAAIGPGTAAALEKAGIKVNWIPESHSSEGLLKLPILQSIYKQNILIVCGEKSRDLLKETLITKGANIQEIICYRRQCPVYDVKQKFSELKDAVIDIIISTSGESLTNLFHLLGTYKEWLQQIPLLVINHSMYTQAKQWGMRKILLTSGASEQAIFATLQEYTDGK